MVDRELPDQTTVARGRICELSGWHFSSVAAWEGAAAAPGWATATGAVGSAI